jgi:hypothetical protein
MITARLHATRDSDEAPVILQIDTAPSTLTVPGPLGLDSVYVLRSKFLPAAMSTDVPTADYVFDRLA